MDIVKTLIAVNLIFNQHILDNIKHIDKFPQHQQSDKENQLGIKQADQLVLGDDIQHIANYYGILNIKKVCNVIGNGIYKFGESNVDVYFNDKFLCAITKYYDENYKMGVSRKQVEKDISGFIPTDSIKLEEKDLDNGICIVIYRSNSLYNRFKNQFFSTGKTEFSAGTFTVLYKYYPVQDKNNHVFSVSIALGVDDFPVGVRPNE